MKIILTVIGTRPEAIKLAPVIQQLKENPDEFETIVGISGQHDGLLKQVLDVFHLVPDFNLGVMRKDQSLSRLTGRILTGMDRFIKRIRPDMLIVQGDTTTVFAAALAAYYHQVPVAHVEAGLTTGDKYQPFPEEINRTLTDQLSDLFFAPTPENRLSLLKRGIPEEKIHITGNTIVEALIAISRLDYIPDNGIPAIEGKMILITAHRRENFGEPFRKICEAIRQMAVMHPDIQFLYPLHPNPNVSRIARDRLSGSTNIKLLKPMDYLSFVYLMKKAFFILTDSGGIQEEAPTLHKPVLILRNKTERQEIVEAGGAILVGTDPEQIMEAANRLIEDEDHYRRMAETANPYGDGTASSRIVEVLKKFAWRI